MRRIGNTSLLLFATLLAFSAGCKKLTVQSSTDSTIFPLEAGNFWQYADTIIVLVDSIPTDTFASGSLWKITEKGYLDIFVGDELTRMESYRMHYEEAGRAMNIFMRPENDGVYVLGFKDSVGLDFSSVFVTDEPTGRCFSKGEYNDGYFVKFPVSAGESWTAPAVMWSDCQPQDSIFDDIFNESIQKEVSELTCLSTSRTVATVFGQMEVYDFGEQWWAENIGMVYACDTLEGTETELDQPVHYVRKRTLIDYIILP